MQVAGRLLMAPVSARLSLRTIAAGVLAIQPVAIALLLLVPGGGGVVLFMALFGAAKGCLTLVRPAFVADLYGRQHYASIAGVMLWCRSMHSSTLPRVLLNTQVKMTRVQTVPTRNRAKPRSR